MSIPSCLLIFGHCISNIYHDHTSKCECSWHCWKIACQIIGSILLCLGIMFIIAVPSGMLGELLFTGQTYCNDCYCYYDFMFCIKIGLLIDILITLNIMLLVILIMGIYTGCHSCYKCYIDSKHQVLPNYDNLYDEDLYYENNMYDDDDDRML